VSPRERVEALLHGRSRKPTHHRLRTKLDEQPLTAILDRGEPLWFEGDLRALDVGLIFAVDIRRHRFEACEADQSENLAQAVYLNYSFDAVAAL
jgi:hypothetical protein